ncbi:MAG: eL32 family ribosomal protein [Candidatus Woesearchaeota archaeon]
MDHIDMRKELKKRKPVFRRQDSHKKKRVSRTGYRRPKGIQSKVRLNKRGYVKKVKTGYGSPSDVKGMHPLGLFPFMVENVSQLSNLDTSKEGAIISSGVGERKRLQIVKDAISKKITLLNIKDPEQYMKDIETRIKKQKELRNSLKANKKKKEEKKKEEKTKSTADVEKDAKQKQEDKTKSKTADTAVDDTPVTGETKKEEEKKEKDKVLTKKE